MHMQNNICVSALTDSDKAVLCDGHSPVCQAKKNPERFWFWAVDFLAKDNGQRPKYEPRLAPALLKTYSITPVLPTFVTHVEVLRITDLCSVRPVHAQFICKP
jgi:hypothetical protein